MSCCWTRTGVAGGLLLCAAAGAGWSQGYRIERNRLVVEGDHWQAWSFPKGSLSFGAGGLWPRLISGRANPVLDAGTFRGDEGAPGGIRDAGSNPDQAARVLDGREDTFWEPVAGEPLEKWWVEIDLGRLVWAEGVVVRFADEGDPMLQFKVLASEGLPAFSQSKVLNYRVIGRSEGLNRTQRRFAFALRPAVEADPGFPGDLIQFLQVVATASARGQAEEISQDRWDNLPAAERGDVLYFRRRGGGLLTRVDRSEYLAIADTAQRGPVRYYRRERPRLAEVEVIGAGDNISLGALERGGRIEGYGSLGSEVLAIDGNYRTFYSVEGGSSSLVAVQDPDRNIFFDLGVWYWMDRVLIAFDKFSGGGAMPNYQLSVSDGRRAPDGSLIYVLLGDRGQGGFDDQNRQTFFQDNPFALTKARFLKVAYHIVFGQSFRANIRELMLFGRGFLPQVTLTSGLIELGRTPRLLSTIAWEAQVPAEARLQLRTRTGNQIERQVHYFNSSGAEVTQDQYRKLLSFQRGDSVITFVPDQDWSNWSQVYLESGAAVTSPSPRRYAMIEATLSSDDPQQAVSLNRLSVELAEPLVSQLTGELAPLQVGRGGERRDFTLFLRPQFQASSRGFDQVLVESPPGAGMELVEVAVGREGELAGGGGQVYGLAELARVPSGPDSLWVRLPVLVGRQEQELVALRFSGTLYQASNSFAVAVGLGSGEELLWQRADAGDATGLAPGRGLVVQTPFAGSLVGEVAARPNPFTPNGDGINEAVEFEFSVFKVQGSKPLVLEVYDLSGQRVRRLEQTVGHAAGRQRLSWDGCDQAGRLLPPGLYLCRVGLEVDAEDVEPSRVARVVSLVY